MLRYPVSITSDGAGAGTGYTAAVNGLLHGILYVPDATLPYDTGVDFTITEEDSTLAILTVTNAGTSMVLYMPRAATVSIVNVALLYSAAAPVAEKIPVKGRVKIVIAQAVAAKVGQFYVYVQ